MTESRPSINEVWLRLKSLEGQEFETKTGKHFTFTISGDVFRPSRTKYNISKEDFAQALARAPFDGPGVVNRLVRGPAYIWATLHDRRVRRNDW